MTFCCSFFVSDHCTKNKTQPICQSLPRCQGKVKKKSKCSLYLERTNVRFLFCWCILFSKVYSKSSYMSFFRKDIKDIKEDTGENHQSSYSHCKYFQSKIFDLKWYIIRCCQIVFSCILGSQVLGLSLLPPLTPSLGLPFRCHRHLDVNVTPPWGTTALPRTPAHIPIAPIHPVSVILYLHMSRDYTTSSVAINKKVKQMLLRVEWFAFLWPLCEWSHRAVNTWSSNKVRMEGIFIPLTVALVSGSCEKLRLSTKFVLALMDF